jgi:hypothetical protein
MLYAFFWVIRQCLKFICQRFTTLCLFHLHRQVGMKSDRGKIVAVLIWQKVWLENSLSQSEGGFLFLYSDLPPPHHPPSDWLELFSSQTFTV